MRQQVRRACSCARNLRRGPTIRAAPIATIWQRRRSDGDEEEARDEARGEEERTPRAGNPEACWRQDERQAFGGEASRAGGEALQRQEGWRQAQHGEEVERWGTEAVDRAGRAREA